jgi:putative oxidoreductase
MAIGLLLLRLVAGLTLAAHGTQKLFGWFGGGGPGVTGQAFESLGFYPGRRHAVMAGLAETSGGLLLALGFLTPVAAAAIVAVMLVAVVSVHLKNGFFVGGGGFEYNLILATVAVTLALAGPGAWSVDALLGDGLSGPVWGAAALVAGLLGGASQLVQRRVAAATPEPATSKR